jgi:hypothetical protein
MVSILTLTYQRHWLLEEAIHSYLLQLDGYEQTTEMVVINDSPDVEYVFDHPNVRIINCKKRFGSIGKKLEWGFKQCKGNWIYRLDDDDLLSPYALEVNEQHRKSYPNKDILRDKHHYYFVNNEYDSVAGSINNGNCYSKKYIERVGNFVDRSGDEDKWLTYDNGADIYDGDLGKYTMIYRWGMNTYHISTMGDYHNNESILSNTDKQSFAESGVIKLKPHFDNDYWKQILI